MRVTKATPDERTAYRAGELYGWMKVDGMRCAVERCEGQRGDGDPMYEVRAPEGKVFNGWMTRGVYGTSLSHLTNRVSGAQLVESP